MSHQYKNISPGALAMSSRTVMTAIRITLSLVIISSCSISAHAQATDSLRQTGPVYVVPISGMIDNGLAVYVDRAVADAEQSSAAAIVFHIDTFGGLVDAADQIRKTILDTPLRTIAYIEHNAASAGALISYAADTIIMAPGSSIGAATVVEGVGGDAAPDKYQSYMRGLMRSTAEANGRDPQIAEAMVDQDLVIEGISPAGQVLTLSTSEALKLGVADLSAEDLADVFAVLGLDGEHAVMHESFFVERLLRFFGSPVVQSILMLMMLGGLYFELQTPGVGFAGLMALLGAALFFGPHYMLGLAESWEVVVFVAGVVLIVLEIFVVPGFGFTGIAGIILLVASLGASLIGNVGFSFPALESVASAVWTLAITLLLLVALMVSLSKYIPRSERFGQLVLAPELSSALGFTAAESRLELLDRTGTALTALRPSGTVMVGDLRVDVVTSGEYIVAGSMVRIVSVRGSRVEVRSVSQNTVAGETST
jgi:membrane-bound serine protease (ClpP class)